ncbi:MAG: hypothetical protein RL071_5 [Pseudomonadota bacterium]|jgi:hypothetical protein
MPTRTEPQPSVAPAGAARPRAEGAVGLALLLAWTALRLLAADGVELRGDEAWAWLLRQHPAPGYVDGPPAVQALLALGEAVGGRTEVALRAPFVLLGALSAALAAVPTRDRELGLLTLATLPTLCFGGLWVGPDAPLLAAWTLGLVAATRGAWLLVGVAVGLAGQASTVGLALLPLLVAARPQALRERGLWLGMGALVVILSPYAIWNLQHELLGWRTELGRLLAPPEGRWRLGVSLLMLGPAAPLLVLWVLIGWRGDPVDRLCWWSSAPVLLLGALWGGEAGFGAVAWVGPSIGLARWGGRWARAGWAAGGVAAVLCLIGLLHLRWPVAALPQDPRDAFAGGRALGESVRAWDIPVAYTDGMAEAGLVAFYGGVDAAPLPGMEAPAQAQLWPTQLVDHALYVRPWGGNAPLPGDALGYAHGPPGVVGAWVNHTDGEGARQVRRWQVYELTRVATTPDEAP